MKARIRMNDGTVRRMSYRELGSCIGGLKRIKRTETLIREMQAQLDPRDPYHAELIRHSDKFRKNFRSQRVTMMHRHPGQELHDGVRVRRI